MWGAGKVLRPDSLFGFENADKGFHESWEPGDNLLDFPAPFRALITGPPNSGKSTVVKNILVRQQPPFDRVVIVHCDIEHTQEYKDIMDDAEEGTVLLMSEIPPADSWDTDVDQDGETCLLKTLLIIDDIDLKTLNKEQRKNLDRTCGYVSTHRNVSVCICTQDSFAAAPNIRRMMNIFVIWRSPDLEALAMVARKVGVKDLEALFDKHCKHRRDSIWIDLTTNSPAPLRLNGFTVIKT